MMINSFLSFYVAVLISPQEIFGAALPCDVLKHCIPDHVTACAVDELGYLRQFRDSCEMLEINCRLNKGFNPVDNQFCEELLPDSNEKEQQIMNPDFTNSVSDLGYNEFYEIVNEDDIKQVQKHTNPIPTKTDLRDSILEEKMNLPVDVDQDLISTSRHTQKNKAFPVVINLESGAKLVGPFKNKEEKTGLPIAVDPRVHEKVFQSFLEYVKPEGYRRRKRDVISKLLFKDVYLKSQ